MLRSTAISRPSSLVTETISVGSIWNDPALGLVRAGPYPIFVLFASGSPFDDRAGFLDDTAAFSDDSAPFLDDSAPFLDDQAPFLDDSAVFLDGSAAFLDGSAASSASKSVQGKKLIVFAER